MKYIKVFFDWTQATEGLNSAQKGRLIDALVEYARSGELPEFKSSERFVFPLLKAQIDREKENYEKVSAIKSESGRKGAQVTNARAAYAGICRQDKEKDKDQDQDNDKDQDKDEDKDGNPSFLKKIDEHWRHSSKARAAVTQLLVDQIVSEKLPCANYSGLYDMLLEAMTQGLSPRILYAAARAADRMNLGLMIYEAQCGRWRHLA